LDLGVLTRGRDRGSVLETPRPEHEPVVAQLHRVILRVRERAALRRPSESIRRLPTLPGGCPPSTIGAGGLNFAVRNGKRCTPAAMTTEIVKALRAWRVTLKTP